MLETPLCIRQTIFTAEARRTRSKKFLIKKYSDLCELCVSAVNFVFSSLIAALPRSVLRG
jgi:hypothetical protein